MVSWISCSTKDNFINIAVLPVSESYLIYLIRPYNRWVYGFLTFIYTLLKINAYYAIKHTPNNTLHHCEKGIVFYVINLFKVNSRFINNIISPKCTLDRLPIQIMFFWYTHTILKTIENNNFNAPCRYLTISSLNLPLSSSSTTAILDL